MLAGRNDLADLLDEVDDLVDLTGLAQKVVDLGGGLLAEVAGGVVLQLGHGDDGGLDLGWEDELVGAVAAEWGAKLAVGELRLIGLESVGQEHWGVGGAASGDALWELWADVVDDEVGLRAPRRIGENAKESTRLKSQSPRSLEGFERSAPRGRFWGVGRRDVGENFGTSRALTTFCSVPFFSRYSSAKLEA